MGTTTRRFRILNVFAVPGDRLSGNPLCVFEDGSGLTDVQMQALARQFNLSETTFLLAPTLAGANARVRIFTPGLEMPFAGHPTLGSAHVVRGLGKGSDKVVLEMKAGAVAVAASNDRWQLQAPRAPTSAAPRASRAELAAMLGLSEADLGDRPLSVDTGVELLLVPLRSAEAVRRAKPDPALLTRHARAERSPEAMVYVWAAQEQGLLARFFFEERGGVIEDPATGSACANLGGWMIATGQPLPARVRVRQGEQAGRPSWLDLEVDAQARILVAGEVIELGRGAIEV